MKKYFWDNRQERERIEFFFKENPFLITIDGPSGVGKTTVSRGLSELIGYRYLDTGALYRGIAFFMSRSRIRPEDDGSMREMLKKATLEVPFNKKVFTLRLNGEDITPYLRSPEISMLASKISAKPFVRDFLLEIQRKMGLEKRLIAEGRDMGTVVFPEADAKFFLDAAHDIRASRRFKESPCQTYEEVSINLKQRDESDCSRPVAPLRPSPDAVLIDSSDKTIEDVIGIIVQESMTRTGKGLCK